MTWPNTYESFPTWENKDLSLGIIGSVIDALILNEVFRLLEALQTSLGVNFISGFADLKTRLADMDSEIAGAGDFKSDGSVPMSGDLNGGGNNLNNFKGGLWEANENSMELEIRNNKVSASAYSSIKVGNSPYGVYGVMRASNSLGGCVFGTVVFEDTIIIANNVKFIKCDISATTIEILQKILVSVSEDITMNGVGKGLVVTTPDGTKKYRIRVDNAGAVTTDLMP